MKLIDEWRAVLTRAWSIRLMLLAGILSGAEIALPIIDQVVEIPRGIFAALSGLVTCGALVARLVVQTKIKENDNEQA